jgi:hypothetical protein
MSRWTHGDAERPRATLSPSAIKAEVGSESPWGPPVVLRGARTVLSA